ncbi:PAAR domain-containing protein [Duganella radicis]|uniref:PAAR domain-containing protein n=1 Tax=Duganella radicis TaxID=551988 RepID=A0A6L6PK40_9BURK|nr:PAAR domain-containing protein [Duganella radicis]MTV39333.1 PAAR domain-containing protein [Duganella radicis]
MGEKAIIRLGDRTSHGGTVIEGHQVLIIHGKPAAGVGHKVHCPKCSGTITIVEGAMNFSMMGINVAVEGMKTSCGATLIASQITDTVEYGTGNAGDPTSRPAPASLVPPSALQEKSGSPASTAAQGNESTDNYDEQVRVVDQDGQPIAGMPYHITDETGNAYKGVTDRDGCCERVYTESVQSLKILTGVLAMEKWQ